MTPRRLTPIGLAAVLAAVALAPADRAAAGEEPALPTAQVLVITRVAALETQLLGAINALRAKRGLRPLRAAPRLRAAGVAHSTNMARIGFFDHSSASGVPFWRRIRTYYGSTGYRRWTVGENIVYGSPAMSVAEAVNEWLASPPHRANLYSRTWREAGIGAVHALSAPGVYENLPTTVITLELGFRAR